MKNITCIEDTPSSRVARCRALFSIMLRPAPIRRRRCVLNREDMKRVKLRQRVLVDMMGRDLSTTIIGERQRFPSALSRRDDRIAARQR